MPKTTIKARKKRWELFVRECRAASLRRDDLLNRTLPGEITLLEAIPPCDEEGARWLKKTWVEHWESTDRELQSVPLTLSDEVIAKLNVACNEKMVPRDAFVDCALRFLTTRLYEAVVVIKTPRTFNDLASRIASALQDEEAPDRDRHRFIVEYAEEWAKERQLFSWDQNFYQRMLSYNAERVSQETSLLDL